MILTELIQAVVNLPLNQAVYDYHLPADLAGKVQAGSLVIVPFGTQRVQAVVLGRVEQAQVPETRPVEALLDARPVLTLAQLNLARWLAEEYCAPLADCVRLMLPPGLSQQADTLFTLTGQTPAGSLTTFQAEVLRLLEKRGPLRGRQLEAAFPHQDWKPGLRILVQKGWLKSAPILPDPSVRPKVIRTLQLARPLAEAQQVLQENTRSGHPPVLERRLAVLTTLAAEGMPVNAAWVYAASGAGPADVQRLVELGLILAGESELWRDPLEGIQAPPVQTPELTGDQQVIWNRMQPVIEGGAPCLLHGVTGSGKTEIYLRAVEDTLARGRQAIILVPEISLTPQTVRRFMGRFPGRVGLMHSKMSAGERYDTWRRARQGDLAVMVGPRSALFTPLPDPGLIVLDECHDPSYYQSDVSPAYHAVKAARVYARLLNAGLILGSATPTVEQVYQAQQENWPAFSLPLRVLAHRQVVRDLPNLPVEAQAATLPLPPVTVVDMREELKSGNRSMFSRALQASLAAVLERGEQAILFLNRRGSSTYVFCRECGFVLRCPRCDLPLAAHEKDARLMCHSCGYTRQSPARCPQCGSAAIRAYGAGTEKVQAEVSGLFPAARVLRWDAETASQKNAHEIILSHFVNHRADILVGTQMLAKGLDLPLVTLVGVMLADVGLNLPDYLAAERGFALLTQVAGRAGRSPLGGRVFFQTFQPDLEAIQFAARYDSAGFYQRELENRRRLGYPPFARLVRLLIQDEDAHKAREAAESMADRLQYWMDSDQGFTLERIGPAPCFYARLNRQYRWQIILRGARPDVFIRRHLPLPSGWRVEVDPPDLL